MNLLARHGETVTLEYPDGTTVEVEHVLCVSASESDQSVMDVQTRFINQARYRGDSLTLTVWWPKDAPHDLMDTHLWIRGERYAVYAAPFAVNEPPTAYDMRVTCTRSLFLYTAKLLRVTSELDSWGVPHPTYDGPECKVNLLRLSEMAEGGAGRTDLARVVLLELEPGAWDMANPYAAFEFDGHFHRVKSVDTAGEQVVVGGTREVWDG